MKHADRSVFSIAVAGWNSSGPLPLFGGFSVLRPLFYKSCVTVGQIRFDSIRLWTLSQNSKASQSHPVHEFSQAMLEEMFELGRCTAAALPGDTVGGSSGSRQGEGIPA